MEIRSEDILTMPNVVSATGFAMVLDGARKIDEPLGLAEVAAGRLLDLTDGAIARRTGQCSELGAAVDANLDKFGGLAILIAEWRKGIAPRPAIAGIFMQNLANGVATAIALRNHPDEELKRSKAGGYAMAAQNVGLFAYAAAHLTRESAPKTSKRLRMLGHVATGLGVGVFGTKATYGYIKRAKR